MENEVANWPIDTFRQKYWLYIEYIENILYINSKLNYEQAVSKISKMLDIYKLKKIKFKYITGVLLYNIISTLTWYFNFEYSSQI